MTQGSKICWLDYLHAVLWADRTTIRRSTGKTPYEVLYGCQCVLPIELKTPSWSTLPWHTVGTRADLLEIMAQQLYRRDQDLEEAAAHVERMRATGKAYWDEYHDAADSQYQVGDIVLLLDIR